MALGEQPPRRAAQAKWAEAGGENEGGTYRTIELAPDCGSGEAAPEVEGHAMEPSPLPSLRSFKSGSRKTRRLEWNVQDYTIKLPRKRTYTILRDIGANVHLVD